MSGKRIGTPTRPERLGALTRLPLFFALQDKRALIAGGGAAAAWKAELLSATGARVEIYAADPSRELLQLAADAPGGNVAVQRRVWTAEDLPGAAIAVGDFGDEGEAAAFAAAARNAGVPVNVIDKPAHCDFFFGAIVNRSPLVIGIATDGAAPVFAQAIRSRLEALLPNGLARWIAAAVPWRCALRASGLSRAARRRFWELFVAHALAHANDQPAERDFNRFIADARGAASGIDRGAVITVEADRDDPDSLTLHALRALHAADVILFEEEIPQQVLDFARREARKIRIEKNGEDGKVDAMTGAFAKQGLRVVRLKSRERRDAPRVFAQAPHAAAPHLVPDDLIAAN